MPDINSIFDDVKDSVSKSFNSKNLGMGNLSPDNNQSGNTQTTEMSILSPEQARIKRYRDAYRIAKTINTFGTLTKIAAVIAAGGTVFFFLVIGSMLENTSRSPYMATSSNGIGIIFFFIGVIIGAITGAILFVLGVLISALGQNLFATLDTAVHTSPFMDNTQKAEAMS